MRGNMFFAIKGCPKFVHLAMSRAGKGGNMFFAINGCPKGQGHAPPETWGQAVASRFWRPNATDTLKGGHQTAAVDFETCFRKCERLFGVHPLGCQLRFCKSHETAHVLGSYLVKAAVDFETCFRQCERLFDVHPLGCQLHFCKSHETAHVLGSYLVNGDFGQLRGEVERSR
jgi:hypothetical protein